MEECIKGDLRSTFACINQLLFEFLIFSRIDKISVFDIDTRELNYHRVVEARPLLYKVAYQKAKLQLEFVKRDWYLVLYFLVILVFKLLLVIYN